MIEKISDTEYLINGKMLIDDFNEHFETELDKSDVDTMAGYLITALGTIPDKDEKLAYEIGNVTLISEEMEGSRVLQLKAIFREDTTETADSVSSDSEKESSEA